MASGGEGRLPGEEGEGQQKGKGNLKPKGPGENQKGKLRKGGRGGGGGVSKAAGEGGLEAGPRRLVGSAHRVTLQLWPPGWEVSAGIRRWGERGILVEHRPGRVGKARHRSNGGRGGAGRAGEARCLGSVDGSSGRDLKEAREQAWGRNRSQSFPAGSVDLLLAQEGERHR